MNLTDLAVSVANSYQLPPGVHCIVIVSQYEEEKGLSFGYAATVEKRQIRSYLRDFIRAFLSRKKDTVH